jgi:hypothetical protein
MKVKTKVKAGVAFSVGIGAIGVGGVAGNVNAGTQVGNLG